MKLYESVLNNPDYLSATRKIENIHLITNGKWDWEHGLGHYQRVTKYVQKILLQLNCDDRIIELGMVAALLHDIGLTKGDKVDHALESSRIFRNYININDFSIEELEMLEQAIFDHSNGNNIQSVIGLALVLADKLDVTYHRTINSSIQDKMNIEVQKIKSVDLEINEQDLIVKYYATDNFDVSILKNWNKAIIIPKKVATYLNKNYVFIVNDKEIDYNYLIM